MPKPYRWLVVVIATLLAIYTGLCCLATSHKAPLEFDASIEPSARLEIQAWYEAETRLGREPFKAKALAYAILHPGHPHQQRSLVIPGGGGSNTIQLSYGGSAVATFTKKGGMWRLVGLHGYW